jgi:Flp pilus assembly protein TadD
LVAKTPNSGAAHNQLGWDLALDGQLPEALVETRKAVDLEPNYTHYDSLAMALALSGQGEEAMKVEQDYILVNGEPRNDPERLTLGMVNYANGDKTKAHEEWERARMSADKGTHKLAVEFEAKHS